MPWLRLDDRMYCNRKVLAVSNDATVLWMWCMDYSSDQLTDGILQPHEVQMLAGMKRITDWQAAADELVSAGLFERDGESYRIHDYLQYNPSREQVLAERAENARRQAEWQAKKRSEQGRYQVPANDVPNGVSNGVSNNRPVPVPVPDPIPEDTISDATASLPPEVAQALTECKVRFGAKTFRTPEQRRQYIELYNKHGPELFKRATEWGAAKGFRLGDVDKIAAAAQTMALKQQKSTRPARASPGQPNGHGPPPKETNPERCLRLFGSYGRSLPSELYKAVCDGKADDECKALAEAIGHK